MSTKLGDFTNLAAYYHNRAGYSDLVLGAIAGLAPKALGSLDVADIGAGTGKLTIQLCQMMPASLVAVEPNEAMRMEGIKSSASSGLSVKWLEGRGEETGLGTNTVDWLLMGSSFHWVDLKAGLAEFHRVLRPGGMFTALWNPRDIERSELLFRIDERIAEIVPDLKRVSSGAAKVTRDWLTLLTSTGHFDSARAIHMESKHEEVMSRERYMGIWHSVNDIQVQAGPERWEKILAMIREETAGVPEIKASYVTRAWTVWRKG